MSVESLLLQRYRVERRLGPAGDDGAPLLVVDATADGARRVLRPVPREAVASAARLRAVVHPRLQRILGVDGDDASGRFVVAEYVAGVDLAAARAELSPRHALRIARDAVAGLDALHRVGLAHGDVKPTNVIVDAHGRGRLIDVRVGGDPRGAAGTLHYLAPERLVSGLVTPAADLFAVGALLFELLTGRVPFRGESALEVVRSILRGPPADALPLGDEPWMVEALAVARALLATEPSLRPPSAAALLGRLTPLADDVTEADEADAAATLSARIAAAPAALPGRTRGALDAFVERTLRRERAPRLIARGPAGSGRSTLVQRAEELALGRGVLFLRLDADAADPAQALADSVSRLLGEADSRRLAGPVAAADLADALARLAREAPVMLASDDHGRTPARRALLRQLLEDPAARDVAVIVTGDPGDVEVHLPVDAARERDVLDLEPLDEADIVAFLASALNELAAPEALASELRRRTGGRPALVRATLLRLAATGGVESRGGLAVADLLRLRALQVGEEGVARSGLLDRLTPSARRTLAALATAGAPAGVATLAAAFGAAPAVVAADLAALAAVDLVRASAAADGVTRYEVAIAQESDALARCAAIDAGVLVGLARGLREEAGAGESDAAAGRLLLAAGRRSGARLLARAARRSGVARATETLAWLAAACDARPRLRSDPDLIALEGRALHAAGRTREAEPRLAAAAAAAPAADRPRLVVERAQLLERLGDREGALAALDAALDAALVADLDARRDGVAATAPGPASAPATVGGAPVRSDPRALRAARAWTLFALGRRDEAAAELAGLRGLPPGDPADDLEVAAVRAAIADRDGDRREARLQTIVARRLARRLGRLPRAAHFDSMLGLRDVDAGAASRGMARVRRAVRLLERAEDRRLLPDALTRLGFLRLRAQDPVGALRAFDRAVLLFDRAGNARMRGWARNGLGLARLDLGDPAAAAACLERSVADRSADGPTAGAALSAVNLYRARARQGDLAVARAARRAARAQIEAAAADAVLAELLLAMARDAADRVRRRRLRRLAAMAAAAVARFDVREHAVEVALLEAESCVFEVRGPDALRAARRARGLARARGDAAGLARATAARAAALLVAGRAAASLRAFRAAALFARDPESAAFARLLFARAAMIAMRRGDAAAARAGAEAAREAASGFAARGHVPCAAGAEELATALSAAVRRIETPLDVRRRLDALRQALEASRWVNEGLEVRDVLERILDAGLRLSGAARGFLVVTDDAGRLRFEAARSRGRQDLAEPSAQISRSIVEEAVRAGRTIVTSEARADERFREYRSISNLELLSVMCAPLKRGERVVGALYIDDQARVDRFDEVTREVVEALAEHAAIALDRARLLAEVEGLNARLRADVETRTRERDRARHDLERARRDLAERFAARHIVSRDPRMLDLFALVDRVADADAPVLIEGEPGTGKELIARALHFTSLRRERRFVAINCASLPDALVESELFGYRKGAFTGAVADREGLLAAADGGTLFLDEIGEMPLVIQAKLLRFLQDGEYVPLGDNEPRTARVRVVSATNRSLQRMTEEGGFREDLYWRLKVVRFEVPPLRERRGDVRLLVRHFAASRADGAAPRGFREDALVALERAPWRGNVRELEATIRAVLLLTDRDPIGAEDLPAELRAAVPGRSSPDGGVSGGGVAGDAAANEGDAPLKARVETFERALVADALARHDGNRSRAAEALGITRRWLLKLIEKHGLS